MKEYTSYKLRLKPAILEEAERCFTHYGIRAVKMDDIARNLGISKRTLYELYSTKEDLLCEFVALQHERRHERIKALQSTCDNTMGLLVGVLGLQLESATSVNVNFFKDAVRYPKVAEAMKAHREHQYSYAAQFFAQGVEEGYFLSEVDYDVFNRIVAGTINMICVDNRYDDLDYKQLFLGYLYVVIRGFCTSKGIAIIDKFVKDNF